MTDKSTDAGVGYKGWRAAMKGVHEFGEMHLETSWTTASQLDEESLVKFWGLGGDRGLYQLVIGSMCEPPREVLCLSRLEAERLVKGLSHHLSMDDPGAWSHS